MTTYMTDIRVWGYATATEFYRDNILAVVKK